MTSLESCARVRLLLCHGFRGEGCTDKPPGKAYKYRKVYVQLYVGGVLLSVWRWRERKREIAGFVFNGNLPKHVFDPFCTAGPGGPEPRLRDVKW